MGVALVGPIWAMGGRKRKGETRCGGCVLQTARNGRPLRRWRRDDGMKGGKGERDSTLQMALNGRPGA